MASKFLKSDFLKNAGLLFSSSGVAQLIALIVIPILSRIYSAEEHGIATTFVSLISIGAAFTSLKYEQAIIVEENRSKAKSLVAFSMLINLGFLIILCLSILFFKPFILKLLGAESLSFWIILIPMGIFLAGTVEILGVWWNREKKYAKLSSSRIASTALASAYKLAHKPMGVGAINGLVFGHIIGQVVNVILFVPKGFVNYLKVSIKELKELAKKYKSFPYWAMPSSLINVLGANMPVFIISYFIGSEATGNYGNAIKLTFIPLAAVSYAFSQVYYERLARLKEHDDRILLSENMIKFLFYLAIIPVLILTVWGDIITPFVLGENWQLSGKMVQIIALFYLVMYLSSPFSAAFEVYNKLKLQFVYTAVFTISTALALLTSLYITHDLLGSLIWFCAIGGLVRLAMLYHCLLLIGKQSFSLILKGSLLTAITLIIFFTLRYILDGSY